MNDSNPLILRVAGVQPGLPRFLHVHDLANLRRHVDSLYSATQKLYVVRVAGFMPAGCDWEGEFAGDPPRFGEEYVEVSDLGRFRFVATCPSTGQTFATVEACISRLELDTGRRVPLPGPVPKARQSFGQPLRSPLAA